MNKIKADYKTRNRVFLHSLVIEEWIFFRMLEIARIYLTYSLGYKRKEIAFSNTGVLFVVFGFVIVS